MRKNKNLLKKGMVLAAVSTMIVGMAPAVTAYAYGEQDVSTSTFKDDTDNSADFQNWLANIWQGGTANFADTDQIALTPGNDANDLNFAWYSENKGTPAVMVWKDGSRQMHRYLQELQTI